MTGHRRFAVLAVCTANICRSPMMEIVLRDRLDPERFEIASAGVQGKTGLPMDAMSEMELMRWGLSGSSFRSHPVDSYLLQSADLVVTASTSHRSRLLEDDPQALRRTFTLREFAALCSTGTGAGADDLSPRELVADAAARRQELKGSLDIEDPYRRAPRVHRATADQILEASDVIAQRLNRCPR